jgi:hypothetical protein
VQQITLFGCVASSEAIADRKQGETNTMFTRTGRVLRLVDEMELGADRKMTTEIVPLRMLGRRIVARDPEEIRFEALVATIRQRDAAEGRATWWERAFFMLVWVAGTSSVAFLLAWMKGGL